jgi:hypothetical protein
MDDAQRDLQNWAMQIERDLPSQIKSCKAELSRRRTAAYTLAGISVVAFLISIYSTFGQIIGVLFMFIAVFAFINSQVIERHLEQLEEQRVKVAKFIGMKHYASVITYFGYDSDGDGARKRQNFKKNGLDIDEVSKIELKQRG